MSYADARENVEFYGSFFEAQHAGIIIDQKGRFFFFWGGGDGEVSPRNSNMWHRSLENLVVKKGTICALFAPNFAVGDTGLWNTT